MANKLNVQGTEITLISDMGNDYICLTDMAGAKSDEVRAADVIKNWLRNRYTIEFLGTWEQIHNPNFNVVDGHTVGYGFFVPRGIDGMRGIDSDTRPPSVSET